MLFFARAELSKDPTAAIGAIKKIPDRFYPPLYLACSRIVALKGFEEDICMLVKLTKDLGFNQDQQSNLIEITRAEAELVIMAGRLEDNHATYIDVK